MTAQVLDVGQMEYRAVWDLQKDLASRRARNEVPDTLILVEHDHVITLGRKTSPENLRAQSIPVYQVERGGDATYHGPGQLVGYPIFELPDHDVRKFVVKIESTLTRTVESFGLAAETHEGHRGVWVHGRKIASIGVAVENWVTYHGFALNVNTDMSYFSLIKPCGLDPELLTSMEKEGHRKFDFAAVKARVLRDFSAVFETTLEPTVFPRAPVR
jgi:lipoate-protein ligase B